MKKQDEFIQALTLFVGLILVCVAVSLQNNVNDHKELEQDLADLETKMQQIENLTKQLLDPQTQIHKEEVDRLERKVQTLKREIDAIEIKWLSYTSEESNQRETQNLDL